MADLFANWAALAAVETLNTDYRLPIRRMESIVCHIAIHGGSIEPGSSEMANACAAFGYQTFYALEGIKSSGNADLHITSTNYDEPNALSIVEASHYCFSFHGAAGTGGVAESFIGGLDTVHRDAVIVALTKAGFTASIGSQEINGSDPTNIANKTIISAGVQIEMSNQQRANFFPTGSLARANRETGLRTDAFYAYMRAITSVSNNLEPRPQQTPYYKLNRPNPTDAMSDFETWLNSSWQKLGSANSGRVVTTLPTTGDYEPGDRVYSTADASIYICIANDTYWGIIWRPVHKAIGPWRNVGNVVLWAPTLFDAQDALRPLQIALDNQGNLYLRGVLKWIDAGAFTKNVSNSPFHALPNGMQPRENVTFIIGHDTLTVNTAGLSQWEAAVAQFFHLTDFDTEPSIFALGGNGTGNVRTFYFDGQVEWAVGTGVFES